MMMSVGSLFSGIGGMDHGLERAGMRIEWQVENNEYCNSVLAKHWPSVPRYGDIKTIDWRTVEAVDLVCGGFPCQPFSCAGKQQGKEDERYLWPEVVRCLAVLRPTWFLGENVYGLLHLGIEQVCADLEALGYQVAVLGIPACAVDAPHIRKRVWILAYTESDLRRTFRDDRSEALNGSGAFLADTKTMYVERRHGRSRERESWGGSGWPTEPDVGRVVARVPAWLDGGGLDKASSGTFEIMQAMQCGNGKKAIQWPVRGLGSVQTLGLLLAALREYEGPPKALGNVSLAGSATSPVIMRGVWFNGQTACASCRSKAREQRTVKPSDLVHLLSQLLTCNCGSTRLDPSGTPTENRAHRLKGLGNAVVPAIVEAIGRMIIQAQAQERMKVAP